MNPSEQKSFDLSIQTYRRLLRVYPKGFVNEFGEQLEQTFADLARRALHGGTLRLLLLWMRILPDLGVSAIREHFGASAWLCPPHVRLRWVVACMLGFVIGRFAGDQVHLLGQPYSGLNSGFARSLCLMLALGFLQSAWAFKRPAPDVLRWTTATVVGVFILALPFHFAVFGWPPQRLSMASQFILTLLHGTGIGLLQFFMLPKGSAGAWRWIPMNLFAWGIGAATMTLYFRNYPIMSYELASLASGAIYGCLTCIPLRSILGSGDADGLEGAVKS